MARPRKLTVPADSELKEEEISQPEDPGYSYEDLKKESVRDILADDGDDSKEESPEKPKQSEKTEDADEAKKQNAAMEAEHTRIAEEAARKVVAEQERIKKDAEEETKPTPTANEEYKEIAAKFEAEKGRTPTWDELAEKIEDRAVEKLEKRQADRQRAADEQLMAQQKVENENLARVNAVVDDELKFMYNSGKLTKIQDPNNPSDQGIVERKALFSRWAEVNAERRTKGEPEILSATQIYEYFYTKPNAQPAGANAPILGSRSSGNAGNDESEYSYAEIHNKPFSWFRRK